MAIPISRLLQGVFLPLHVFVIIMLIGVLWFLPQSASEFGHGYDPRSARFRRSIKYCSIVPKTQHTGLWTVNSRGRLGNQLGLYATLYGLAKLNKRPACILPQMYQYLAPLFKITLPVVRIEDDANMPWTHYRLHDWMTEQYTHIQAKFIKIIGFYNSWTFFHDVRGEILKEFTFHDFIKEKVANTLGKLRGNRSKPTYIGVHVRRGDYVKVMPRVWKGVVAGKDYLDKAMAYFRNKYPEPVFVVASNGMDWCKDNIDNSRGDVYFIGDGVEANPLKDFAVLAHCNHTIMTIGTFGFWAAYLAGGETIYLTNFTLPDSNLLKIFRYEAAFLPEWIGIAANLEPLSKRYA